MSELSRRSFLRFLGVAPIAVKMGVLEAFDPRRVIFDRGRSNFWTPRPITLDDLHKITISYIMPRLADDIFKPSPLFAPLLRLEVIKRTDRRILADMAIYYSQPKGFVGRNICYAVMFGDTYYGAIVGGSSTFHLVGRDEFFGLTKETKKDSLKQIVNNIFYHIEKKNGKYPVRNMVPAILKMFRERVAHDWQTKYGNYVIGFESLIEHPEQEKLINGTVGLK